MADDDDVDMRAELPNIEAAMDTVFLPPLDPIAAGRRTIAAIALLRPLHSITISPGLDLEWLNPSIAARVELVINELELLFDEVENAADDTGTPETFDPGSLVGNQPPARGWPPR